jgi:hypothetical protein
VQYSFKRDYKLSCSTWANSIFFSQITVRGYMQRLVAQCTMWRLVYHPCTTEQGFCTGFDSSIPFTQLLFTFTFTQWGLFLVRVTGRFTLLILSLFNLNSFGFCHSLNCRWFWHILANLLYFLWFKTRYFMFNNFFNLLFLHFSTWGSPRKTNNHLHIYPDPINYLSTLKLN